MPPPFYAWPPRPVATLRWIATVFLFPWGLFFIAMSFIAWQYLTPSMETMKTFGFGWVGLIWLRNALLLTMVAGTLQYFLYRRRIQGQAFKFNQPWQAEDDDRFLWRNQVRDNMFWCLASGVTIWTCYEAATWWWYANGYVAAPSISDAPMYFFVCVFGVYFWSTFHFYLNHRLLHWKPLFDVAHELHHRNVNTGPWSGISMHPLEHLIYFTVFLLWWVVPVHPVIILLTGFFQGISPAISHSGFDYLKVGRKLRLSAGDNFHHLHHRFFFVNYGNTLTPIDKLTGSWHDGSAAGKALVRERIRNGRTA